ncbi:MAG TPA: virulence factor SrfB [Chthoniobacterales bacterium]|jgi:hypothetical protein|nr:virulence factor SrfB [Chthoniobacterales bacterium]
MTQISIVPNSGHHFYWVPFDMEVLRTLDSATIRDLEKECREPSAWRTAYNAEKAKAMPWIRFKYSMGWQGADRVLGVNLAVESNLGDVSRGSAISPPEPVAHREYVGQPDAPYPFRNETEITESGSTRLSFGSPGAEGKVLAKIDIEWTTRMAQAPIPVDLIVDFGNTRTVAILLEEPPTQVGSPAEALRQMVRPLRFMERGRSFSERGPGQTIVESWFVLLEPQFQEFELPNIPVESLMEEYVVQPQQQKTSFWRKPTAPIKVVTEVIRRVPHMFVELSPIAVGVQAPVALQRLSLAGGGVSFLSSPKRYAWDNFCDVSSTQNPLFWTMVRNDWNPEINALQNAKLACQMLRFFPYNGSDWDLSSPPNLLEPSRRPVAQPVSPIYPRADALAWMGVAVLEAAYRQMNAPEYWKDNYPFVPRFLRSVQVTHPSGWMAAELDAYKSKWQKAANTFAHMHLEELSLAPSVEFPLDEAIASQLPIVFAEMQHMHGIGENWLRLMGRLDSAGEATVRAMTIDIGGGTTDYAIVEYRDKMRGAGVELTAQLLYKDSTNIAGDEIVRALLERILLPKLGESFGRREDTANVFASFFRQAFSTQTEKETWKRITRLFFIPAVTRWLANMCDDRAPGWIPAGTAGWGLADASSVTELNQLAHDFFSRHEMLDRLHDEKLLDLETLGEHNPLVDVTEDEVSMVIRDRMAATLKPLAKLVSVFEVDVVIVSGKPSELPTIQTLLADILPITTDRVLFAKGFYAGDWYPFNHAGRIKDAKTITAVGLALNKAISNGRVPGWSIQHEWSQREPLRYYWVGISAASNYAAPVYLSPDQDSATVELMVNTRIGRRLLPSSRDPEPTYLFRWRSVHKAPPPRLAVTLKRVPNETAGVVSETLVVEDVRAIGGNDAVALNDVALDVCTLGGEDYWLDNPRFSVSWPD